MSQIKIILLLYFVLLTALPAAAGDIGRSYDKMRSDALSHQQELLTRTRRLCRELVKECEHKVLEPGQTVTLDRDVSLHIRKGYRLEPAGSLPAGQSFVLEKKLKGHYRISWPEHNHCLIGLQELRKYQLSTCRDRFSRCNALAAKDKTGRP